MFYQSRILKLHLCLAFFCLPSAEALCARASDDGGKNEVLQAEARRIKALVNDDIATLDRIFSPELSYTHSNGQTESKSEYLAALTSGRLKYKSIEHVEQVVRLYGKTAVLTAGTKIVAVNANRESRVTLRFTAVYVVQNGEWQMIAWQSTPNSTAVGK